MGEDRLDRQELLSISQWGIELNKADRLASIDGRKMKMHPTAAMLSSNLLSSRLALDPEFQTA